MRSKSLISHAVGTVRATVRRHAVERARLVSLGLLLACGAARAEEQTGGPDAAGPIVVSTAPAALGVTIYRNPHGADDAPLQPGGWLGGYALVSEEREVDLPAGPAVLRFEGVAAGMLAESAIIGGLPDGVREKNLDADLLSPRNLYARAFGRPVILRRQHSGGQVTEEEAIIRSGPNGAAILQTRQGFEVANCGGLKDGLVYNGLPAGMNARPSFSVATQADHAQHLRIRLTYLAWGFDWRAHYILALRPGAREAEMTAWLTLASGDDTSFPQAQTGVVAGRPNMADNPSINRSAERLVMACRLSGPVMVAAPPAPPPPPAPMAMMERADIIVTSARRMMKDAYVAQAETLGDLKFYRLPLPTSVVAHGQKQVALIAERPVKLALIHTARIDPDQQEPVRRMVRLRNRREDGLGLALPGGQVSVVEGLHGAGIPAAEGHMADKAEGETVDIQLDEAPQVQLDAVVTRDSVVKGLRHQVVRVSVTNANRWPVRFEGKLAVADGEAVASSSVRLGRKDGSPLWEASIPAHGRAVLTYVLADQEAQKGS